MSTLDELNRAVERLNRAVERLLGGMGKYGFANVYNDDVQLLLSERAELLATVERMRGALEPFAKAGAVWDASASPDAAKVFCDLWDDATAASELGEAAPISDPEFTVGDFIRARAALTTGEDK